MLGLKYTPAKVMEEDLMGSAWATGTEPCGGSDALHAGLHLFLWEGFVASSVS